MTIDVLSIETVLPLPKHPGYSVTDLGRVIGPDGNTIRPWLDTDNCILVTLPSEEQESETYEVGRLVLERFAPIPKASERKVGRVDGLKHNNVLENLEWQNLDGSKDLSSLNVPIRVRCLETGEIFPSVGECAKSLGISRASVERVVKGQQPRTRTGYSFEKVYE